LNATVTPAGNPLALIVTAPVKLVRAIATVVAALAPRVTETALGEGETVKSWVTAVVVALTAVLAAETFAVASTARTVYEKVVLAASPVSVNVRPVGVYRPASRRGTPGIP
jgi:hypothetical protein